MNSSFNIKKFLSFILILTGYLSTFSMPLTPDEALSRLKKDGAHRIGTLTYPELKKTFVLSDNQPAVYIFNDQNSTFYVSADDCTVPLLGYSEKRYEDEGSLSPSMQWWLNNYAKQIEYLRNNSRSFLPASGVPAKIADMKPISPLLKTQWDQASPYNDLCPELWGERSVTGCVATAMAQVMNYFQYPEKANGLIAYTPSGFSSSIKMNLGSEEIAWDKMLDNYKTQAYTEEEAHAVAYLMEACGFSVKMQYSPISSGAYTEDIAAALINNFHYDSNVYLESRDYISYDEWASMIYDNITNIGPVLYGGISEEGGHQFICDGYDGEGYFHFNWGWSGISDGYFLLDVLNPMEQGIGGALGGFNFYQSALFNIMPDSEGTFKPEPDRFILYSPMEGIVDGDMLYIGGEENIYLGCSHEKETYFRLGFIIENMEDPGDIQYTLINTSEIELMAGYVIIISLEDEDEKIGINLNDVEMKEGISYKFTLATIDLNYEEECYLPVRVKSGDPNFIIMMLNEEGYEVENLGPGFMYVESHEIPEKYYIDSPNAAVFTIVNPTTLQMTKILSFVMLDENYRIILRSGYFTETLDPDETKNINFEFNLESDDPDYTFKEGYYQAALMDVNAWRLMMDPVEVYLSDGEAPDESKVKFENAEGVYKVVDLTGRTVITTPDVSAIKQLQKGIYIINGKKTVIK